MSPQSENVQNLMDESAALFDQGRLEESAARLEKAILILEQPATADAEQLLVALEKLGALYFGIQDFTKTVSVYSRLVVALDKQYGMEHVETIKAVYKLAKSCEKAGQREQAQTMYYIANESALKTLPEENYLRQSITGSYQIISRPKRVTESVNTFVVGDLHNPEELVKAAKSIPQKLKKLSVRGDIFVSILGSFLLIAGGGLWISNETARQMSEALKQSQAEVSVAVSKDTRTTSSDNSFSTTDGNLKIRFFNEREAEVEVAGTVLKLDVVTITDSLDSVIKAYSGSFGKRAWAVRTEEGIELDNDLRLFHIEGPEMKLADACHNVANTLNDYYAKQGSYPDGKAEIIAAGKLAYINPLSGKSQAVNYQNFSQFMKLDHLFDGATDMDGVTRFLRAGGRWVDEPVFTPGEIHCVSRYSGERRGEDFVVPSAFMHVAGKDSQLLPGSLPGEAFLLELQKGIEVKDGYVQTKLQERIRNNFRGKTLFYVKSQGLFTNAWLWRNLTTVFLTTLFILSLTWWFVFDARARLKMLGRIRPVLSEIFVGLTFFLFLCWIILAATLNL